MSRNAVQFQKGLGLAEFQRLYGTEDQCHEHLVTQRWPDGFVCSACGGRSHSYAHRKRIFQCSACRKQISTRSGTIFHASRTPLTKWYLAIHLLTSAKNDVAALELARQLDVKWDTAWLIKQKLMEAMRLRNRAYKLKGTIQIDDAYSYCVTKIIRSPRLAFACSMDIAAIGWPTRRRSWFGVWISSSACDAQGAGAAPRGR